MQKLIKRRFILIYIYVDGVEEQFFSSDFLPLIHFNKDWHSKCTEIYDSLQAAQLNLTYSEKLYRKCWKI